MTKYLKEENGFTLIELLIGLFIISTIGTLVVGILWVSLKSTVKINNMNIIRHHSNYAVLQITKMLQFAKEFQGVSQDGITFTTNCESPSIPVGSIYSSVRISNHDGGITTLSCLGNDNTIASNSASLFSIETFEVTDCNFTCTQISEGSSYSVGFRFKVQKKTDGNILDDPAALNFQNTVTIRNSYL